MSGEPVRDLIGYGANPPHAAWPGGARIALQIVLNYEEGSEYSIGDGDGRSEAAGGDLPAVHFPDGRRNMAMESSFEYGSRVGVWRLLRLFENYGLPITVFACALALEKNPEVAAAIRRAGHDICCHGWRWVEHFAMEEDEERDHIRRAIASIEKTMGERPLGWYCRFGASENTRRLLAEEGGFLYDSDAYNDELPYWVEVSGKPRLVVPYSLDTNDGRMPSGATGTGEQFIAYLTDSFDTLLEEGTERPKMMSVGLHARNAGRPGRTAGLKSFLDYVSSRDDAWICRRMDIARHWIAQHPHGEEKGTDHATAT